MFQAPALKPIAGETCGMSHMSAPTLGADNTTWHMTWHKIIWRSEKTGMDASNHCSNAPIFFGPTALSNCPPIRCPPAVGLFLLLNGSGIRKAPGEGSLAAGRIVHRLELKSQPIWLGQSIGMQKINKLLSFEYGQNSYQKQKYEAWLVLWAMCAGSCDIHLAVHASRRCLINHRRFTVADTIFYQLSKPVYANTVYFIAMNHGPVGLLVCWFDLCCFLGLVWFGLVWFGWFAVLFFRRFYGDFDFIVSHGCCFNFGGAIFFLQSRVEIVSVAEGPVCEPNDYMSNS